MILEKMSFNCRANNQLSFALQSVKCHKWVCTSGCKEFSLSTLMEKYTVGRGGYIEY